jgi:hypothetical protein
MAFIFGSVAATNVSCSSDTTCTATTPPGAGGTVDVLAQAGTTSSSPAPPGDQYTYTVFQVAPTSLPDGSAFAPYNASLTASNGNPPFHWTRISGSLPRGIRLHADGSVSGTPLVGGSFTFTIHVVDHATRSHIQQNDVRVISLVVHQPVPVVALVHPNVGPPAGGTRVVISGSALEGATSVMFGQVPATTFRANGAGTRIVAIAPPGSTGVVDITVTTVGGTSSTVPGDEFAFVS